jgi:transcriptional regulator with XRE-family HTH domain
MRSAITKQILDETPTETRVFVKKYADILVRINQLLKEKGWSQQNLAEALGKKPSEVSKWLSGNHNLTLRSIAKLEAELGSDILYVPRSSGFTKAVGTKVEMTVYNNAPVKPSIAFTHSLKLQYKETA